ncbi:hypothetical protein PNP85_11180 [Halobacterium salinarum]|uniref:hypothetical protein n=1 Tax=Halobacterium salinarum TaxID=2242 RepID=UPI002552D54F|nr:hypothetical protein [Halobacterium salinarum]MDL0140065.1 hypothetical protein [Halobacterium salinarum]
MGGSFGLEDDELEVGGALDGVDVQFHIERELPSSAVLVEAIQFTGDCLRVDLVPDRVDFDVLLGGLDRLDELLYFKIVVDVVWRNSFAFCRLLALRSASVLSLL